MDVIRADSGQIAKARELAERLTIFGRGDDPYESNVREITADLLAFAASERQAVIEDCAKKLCHFCLSGDVPTFIKQSGAWLHSDGFQENKENGSWPFQCRAAAIRSME